MKMKLLYIIPVFLSVIFCGIILADEEIGLDVYLPPHHSLYSPNEKYKCVTERSADGELKLFLYSSYKDSKTLVCSTMRTLGVAWAPNSKWMAVMNNYAASETSVLIFELDEKTPVLLYQTPFLKGDAYSWEVESWNTHAKTVTLKRTGKESQRSLAEVVSLERK